MDSTDLWKSIPVVATAIIATLGALYKSIKSLFEFNDEYLGKRKFKRLSFLSDEVRGDLALEKLLMSAKHEEVFRAIFGKPASPKIAAAVMSLYASGLFSIEELRASSHTGNAKKMEVSIFIQVL